MKFESWFEEQLYPIIRRVAVKYGLEFHYQFSLKESVTSSGLRDWVEEAGLESEAYHHDCRLKGCEGGCKYFWESNCEFERYRLDFFLQGKQKSIIIELDGGEFHKDFEVDAKRERDLLTRFFSRRNCKIVRITFADYKRRHSDADFFVENLIREALGLRQLRKDIKGAEANHFSLSNYGKKDDWVVAK